MGYDRKYGKVTTEHGDIPDDEPVIVFRARDRLVLPVLGAYLELCKHEGSPQRHLDTITRNIHTFADWQEANPDKVRTPDSERSRAWMPE
jgi:hypothetical protein